MTQFLPAIIGGALIGASALWLYASVGRIAGISGIFYGLIWGAGMDRRWRLVFLVALALGGAIGAVLLPRSLPAMNGAPAIAITAIAGLLVGFGTRMGNGCTSGHGICGLSRLSMRSLAATVVFMIGGVLVATLVRPLVAQP